MLLTYTLRIGLGVSSQVSQAHQNYNYTQSSSPPKTPAAAPTKPPPIIIALIAAPAVNADAVADPDLKALADAAALLKPSAGV